MTYLVVQITGSDLICARFTKRRSLLQFNGGSRQTVGIDNSMAAILNSEAAAHTGEQRVILLLPPRHFFLRELELPITDRRKLRDIIPLELRGETVLDTDQLLFDAIPLANGNVLAVWGKIADLSEQIRLLTEQGLEPAILSAAMFNWQHILPAEGKNGVTALCDGESLAIFDNGKPVFFRGLGEEISVEEAQRSLTALRLGKGITVARLYYHGKAASRAASSLYPDTSSEMAVSSIPPDPELTAIFAGDNAATLDLASCYAAAKACSEPEPVNFRHGKLAYITGEDQLRRKLRLPLLLAAIIALLLCLEVGIRYYQVRKDLKSLEASISAIYREVFPNRKKAVDPVAEIRSEIKRLSSGAGGSALDTLNRLAAAKGTDINGLFEVELDGGQLRLKGDAGSAQAVTGFKGRLQSSLSSVEIGEIKSRPDGSVTFTLRGTLKEGKQ